MFVLILWGFDIEQASPAHSVPSPSVSVLLQPVTSPQQAKNKEVQLVVYILNTVTSNSQCLASYVERSPSPPMLLPEAISVESSISASFLHLLVSCPGCYFQRWGLLQKASISLFPNCASVVINITGNVASLLVTVRGCVEHELPNGFCRQYKPQRWPPSAVGKWTQTGSSEAAWTMNISRASWLHRPFPSI